MRFSLAACTFASLVCLGCPSPTTTPDAPAPVDAPGSDAAYNPGIPVATTGMDRTGAPTLGCLGTATAPTAGAAVTGTFALTIFGGAAGRPAPNTRVQLFRDNRIATTCTAPTCAEFTTDSNGQAMVSAPASGWYAYRVFENLSGGTDATRFNDSIQVNKGAPSASGGTFEGNAVSLATTTLIPLSLGLERTLGTTILAGRVQDCTGTNIEGALVRAYLASGQEILEAPPELAGQPHYRYFQRVGTDTRPSNDQPHTNFEGLYAAINIPAAAGAIRVESWARLASGGPVVRTGCETIEVLPDGVSIVNIGPLRSDYPSGHACATP